jgi:hypothetical protein
MMKVLRNAIENETTKEIIEWAKSENLIIRFSTAYIYNKYKSGEISEEKAYKKAYDKMLKTMHNDRNKKLEKLAKIEQAQDIEQIKISVEWKKSYTWGMNPHVELSAYSCNNCYTSTASASGCGYDKESQAVAEALNSIYGIKKLLVKKIDFIKEQKPYGITTHNIIPCFSGGVGMNCFTSFFKEINWNVSEMHGKTYDCYIFTKN